MLKYEDAAHLTLRRYCSSIDTYIQYNSFDKEVLMILCKYFPSRTSCMLELSPR